MNLRKARITVIGSANIDFIMRVPRLPVAGETVLDGTFAQAFGGKGANQAVAAARAGAATAWVGATGDDPLSASVRASLAEEGVDLAGGVILPGRCSGTALIMVEDSGENCIAVDSAANGSLEPELVEAAAAIISASDWILLQMEIPAAANLRALEIASREKVPVLFNYAPASQKDFPLDERIAGLIVNETEASALLGRPLSGDSVEICTEGARALCDSGGHRFVVLTLGAWGAVIATEEGCLHVPPFTVSAVDATAAGDTFCGYFATGLAEGLSLPEAARLASAASALAVSRAGAQPSIPRRAETVAFLAAR